MSINITTPVAVNGWTNLLTAIVAKGYSGTTRPLSEAVVVNNSATACYLHFTGDGETAPNISGTSQVETTTIVAAAGVTGDGDLIMTITGAGITGSPLDVTVPLTAATHTTAALIASAVRTALSAESAITDLYTVGGTGADIVFTQILQDGNDGTLNIDINADDAGSTVTGITNDATSTNTTAGVHAGLGGIPIATASAPSSAYQIPKGTDLATVWLYAGSAITPVVSVEGE